MTYAEHPEPNASGKYVKLFSPPNILPSEPFLPLVHSLSIPSVYSPTYPMAMREAIFMEGMFGVAIHFDSLPKLLIRTTNAIPMTSLQLSHPE